MNRTTLKIKGTGVPRICTWILGFVHGRILKTAVLDSETGYICSCYLINKWKLFEQYSFERVKQLELELKAVRSEAASLMAKEAQIRRNLENDVIEHSKGVSIDEKRAAGRCLKRQSAYKKNHEENMKRLIEIDSKIRSCEIGAKEEISATASELQSRFATYAQGMLLRPVQDTLIPPLEENNCFDFYQSSHNEEMQKLQKMIKETLYYE